MHFNVNTDAVVKHTARLERLSKTAMPNVVRQTLNRAALDVKQTTMPASAKKEFVQRKASFFSANSRVEFAKGNNLSSMRAMVGFKGESQAIEDLEEQEQGGVISGRAFIPMKASRVANSDKKMVRANARLKSIKIVDSKKASGKTEGQKFNKSVSFAGVGGFVLGHLAGNSILWRVNSLKRTAEGKLKLTAMYSYSKGRDVSISGTGFMESATHNTVKKIENIFKSEAEKRIQREFR